jgi:hypothetical protein
MLRVHWRNWRDGSRWAVVIPVAMLLDTMAALAMRKVTRSTGIGSGNRSALGIGIPM